MRAGDRLAMLNTNPPAVTMVPPRFSVPVGGSPFAINSGVAMDDCR